MDRTKKATLPVYEFHPAAADDPMMDPETREAVIADLLANGFDKRLGTIWLCEGKIAVGRSLYECCKAAGVMPVFKTIKPNEIDAFINRQNNLRKHYDRELLVTLRTKRLERIVALREAGMSQRDIAETEKISPSQARRDIKEAQLRRGGAVEPKDGKVTGHDGKSRTAALKMLVRKVLCDRCQRVGNPVENCSACAEARKAARNPKTLKDEIEKVAKSDPENPPTAEERMKAVNSEIESWCRGLMKFAETTPSDAWIEAGTIDGLVIAKLRSACKALRSCKCSHLCPKCSGDGCPHCRGTGRMPAVQFDSTGGQR